MIRGPFLRDQMGWDVVELHVDFLEIDIQSIHKCKYNIIIHNKQAYQGRLRGVAGVH